MGVLSPQNSSRLFLATLACAGNLLLVGTVLAKSPEAIDQQVETLLNEMTLQEKVTYLFGAPPSNPSYPNSTSLDVPPIPRLNLPELRNTDGPVGIRCNISSTRYPANLCLAATWNPERAWDEGKGIGRNMRARGFAIWYGPGIDTYRVPMGGRNSEYMCGEDPYLGAKMVVAQIRGAQSQGIAATAKHFVVNDQEYKRNGINTIVDERTLREIYYPPFEASVKKGKVWSVMLAYNKLNGTLCAENPDLMETLLVGQWRFQGFKVSDYGAVSNPVNSIVQGLDTIYSTPVTAAALVQAVQSGQLPLERVNDAVRRILRFIVANDYQSKSVFDTSIPQDDPFSTEAALNTGREGITLLKNDGGLLPLSPHRTRSIAVIGRYATTDLPSESGSGSVTPVHFTSEITGLQEVSEGATNIVFLPTGNLDFTVAQFSSPGSNGSQQAGLTAEYFDNQTLSGTPVVTRTETNLAANFPASTPSGVASSFSARWTGNIVAPVTGDYAVKFQVSSNARIYVGDMSTPILDDWNQVDFTAPNIFSVLKLHPTIIVRKVHLQAGQSLPLRLEYKYPGTMAYFGVGESITQLGIGWASLEPPKDIAKYDAVVVDAGFDQSYEGEGQDRTAATEADPGTFELPELQNDLIRNVAAANAHTIVVLHGGSSAGVQDWIDQVPVLIQTYFPGQDGGQALAEIIFGDVNPSGKLPYTFEKSFKDNPAYSTYPSDLSVDQTGNTAVYSEGIFGGYRGYEKNGVEPLFPFGFGLSYTKFSYSDLDIQPQFDGDENGALAKVSFTIRNTGDRAGGEVAQLYVGEQNPPVPRPIKELKGFAKVFLQPGESKRVTLELDQRSFAYYDVASAKWTAASDNYNILVGGSSQDIRLTGHYRLKTTLTSEP